MAYTRNRRASTSVAGRSVALGDSSERPPYVHCDCKGGFGPPAMGCSSGGCGCGGGLGADVAPGDPDVVALQQQVNRWVGVYLPRPLAVTGVIDYPTGSAAAQILLARARDVSAGGLDAASAMAMATAVGEALGDPLGFVRKRGAATLARMIAMYSDMKGRPAATGGGGLSLGGVSKKTLVIGGLAIAAAIILLRRGH